jgi:hypothetical protein
VFHSGGPLPGGQLSGSARSAAGAARWAGFGTSRTHRDPLGRYAHGCGRRGAALPRRPSTLSCCPRRGSVRLWRRLPRWWTTGGAPSSASSRCRAAGWSAASRCSACSPSPHCGRSPRVPYASTSCSGNTWHMARWWPTTLPAARPTRKGRRDPRFQHGVGGTVGTAWAPPLIERPRRVARSGLRPVTTGPEHG